MNKTDTLTIPTTNTDATEVKTPKATKPVDPFAALKAQAIAEGKEWRIVEPVREGASPVFQVFN